MLLAIDVGNTNIVFALLTGGDVVGQWRISTDVKRTTDEYAIILKDMIALKNLGFKDIDDVIISSVVPQTMFALKLLAKEYCDAKAIIVGDKDINLSMKIEMDKPQEVGADRLVNAVAAYDKYKQAVIIIDFGTATTFDVVSQEGSYIGGLISPGINLSIDALHQAAAKLPEIAITRPEKVIGKSTVSAMQSGIFFGYLGLIEGIVTRIKEEYVLEMVVIATGGLAPLFSSSTQMIDHLESDLTIKGLDKIYTINN